MLKAVAVGVIGLGMVVSAFAALGDVVGSVPIPDVQYGLAMSESYLYVCANYTGGKAIYRIHPTSGSIFNHFTAAGADPTRGLAYQSGGYLYQVAPFESTPLGVLFKTAEANGSVYESYDILPYSSGAAPLATGDGGAGTSRIIVSNSLYQFLIYYTTTGSMVRSHNTSQPLIEIAYDWRNGLVWGGGLDGNRIYGYNTNGSLVASFTYPGANVYGIAYYGQYLWVGAGSSLVVYRIHCPGTVNVQPASMGKIKAMYR